MKDMKQKGRAKSSGVCGEKSGMAKLTEDEVRAIRKDWELHKSTSQSALAKKYGVSRPLISMIVTNKIWK
jgi:ribosomal protein S25